jgi:hypothetical protein
MDHHRLGGSITSATTASASASAEAVHHRKGLAFMSNRPRPMQQRLNFVLSMRGGSTGTGDLTDDEDEYDSEEEEYDDSEEEEYDDGEEEEEEEEEDTDDEEEEEKSSSTPTFNAPVKVTFTTTSLSPSYKPNPLIDQTIELTASPTRTIASLKQTLSKQLKAKPPASCIVLKLDGLVLHDDEALIGDIVDEHEDDDDDDDDDEHKDDNQGDDDDDDDDDDDIPKLKIQVDIIPPVDPKFGTEIRQRLDDMTNDQVLDAYVANMASMHQNSLDMMDIQMKNSMMIDKKEENDYENENDDENDINQEEENQLLSFGRSGVSNMLDTQKNAITLKERIVSSLDDNALELLKSNDTPLSPSTTTNQEDSLADGDILLKESLKRKSKRRGGATMNIKRTLQKNLNIVSYVVHLFIYLFLSYHGSSY